MIGNILGNVIGFLLMLGVPLAACIYYLWRRDGRIWMFFAGILSFTVSQLLIRIPLLQYAGKKWEWLMLLPYTSLVLYYGFLGLTAGLFEEDRYEGPDKLFSAVPCSFWRGRPARRFPGGRH